MLYLYAASHEETVSHRSTELVTLIVHHADACAYGSVVAHQLVYDRCSGRVYARAVIDVLLGVYTEVAAHLLDGADALTLFLCCSLLCIFERLLTILLGIVTVFSVLIVLFDATGLISVAS